MGAIVKKPDSENVEDGQQHAEMKILRSLPKGAKIIAIGATRPVCKTYCQKGLSDARYSKAIATELEK
jgi:hypothetical protein